MLSLQSPFGRIETRAMAYGPNLGPQLVPLAELFAFLVYLRVAIPAGGKYLYMTDCQYVIDGLRAGKAAMTHGLPLFPGIWKEQFRRVEDIGYVFIKLANVKAH